MTVRVIGLASLFAVAACGQTEPQANDQAEAAPTAEPAGGGEVSAAERLVRARLDDPEGLTFANPRRSASEGVTIVCGEYAQGAASQRYIVVDSTEVFLEPELRPGEMDRYFSEFCVEGSGNRPAPVAPQGNAQ